MRDVERASGWVAEVVVVPKAGVNDPQGEAIRGGLASLGYDGVQRVRSGRFFRLDLVATGHDDAEDQAVQMCDRLLANPVIETYTVLVKPAGRVQSGQGIDK